MVCRRQATGQMRTSCIPPCPSGRTVARIGAAKDHRRPARASIGRVDDPLPQACNRGSEDDRARRAGIGGALMSAWPDPDRAVIARFLGKLRLRSTRSRTYYRRVLHGFQDVAERHPAIDRQVLEVWLRGWGTCWYPSTLLNRARIVDRFLDHLVEKEVIASNPVAVLRGEYGVKHSRPIWQALMSLTPDHALAPLRRPRPFGRPTHGFQRLRSGGPLECPWSPFATIFSRCSTSPKMGLGLGKDSVFPKRHATFRQCYFRRRCNITNGFLASVI